MYKYACIYMYVCARSRIVCIHTRRIARRRRLVESTARREEGEGGGGTLSLLASRAALMHTGRRTGNNYVTLANNKIRPRSAGAKRRKVRGDPVLFPRPGGRRRAKISERAFDLLSSSAERGRERERHPVLRCEDGCLPRGSDDAAVTRRGAIRYARKCGGDARSSNGSRRRRMRMRARANEGAREEEESEGEQETFRPAAREPTD